MTLAVACVFLNAGYSQAQLYKWVDENGKVQYSDTVPPSANDRARKELRSDGTVKTTTDRAATAEEKRQAALRAEEEAKARQVAAERERKDRALLATYTNLQDFDRVRDRALGTLDAEIRGLSEREAVLKKILTEGDAAKPAGPRAINPRLAEAKAELPGVLELMTHKRRDRDDLGAIYANERVRLANLLDAERARNGPPPGSSTATATAASSATTAAGKAAPSVPVRR